MTNLQDRVASHLSGTYSLERELGGGGMSRVFVAEETALGRRVVVKVMSPELAEGLSVAELHEIIDSFREVLRSRGKIHADPEILGDAAAFEGVARYAARVKCAMISWVAAEDALNQAA